MVAPLNALDQIQQLAVFQRCLDPLLGWLAFERLDGCTINPSACLKAEASHLLSLAVEGRVWGQGRGRRLGQAGQINVLI